MIFNNVYFYPTNTISWDVFGYYLYLPLTFISDGSPTEQLQYLDHIISTYDSTETLYQIQPLDEGGFVLKYTSGWAVCYAPFFFFGHLFANITSHPADGFSLPYQIAVFSGSIFYSLIGIYFLLKIALAFFKPKISVLIVLLIIFGTNYLFHNTMYGQNAMTHNLLFTGYTIIIWLTIKWYREPKLKTIMYLGLVCGLVILTRPTEIVCLLIPLLWPIPGELNRIEFFKDKLKQLVIFSIILIAVGSIQLIYWKSTTGKLLFLDYGNPAEGLDFLSPHTIEVLFSFRKGWFVYTPLMALATLGFLVLYRKNKRLFIPLFIFFITNLYLVSSWSVWWYASSFSQRALIPSMAVMIVPLGYLLIYIFNKRFLEKLIMSLLISGMVILNVFQTIQFYLGVIPGDRMTKAYYFATFGSLVPNDSLKNELLLIDRNHIEDVDFTDSSKYSKSLLYHNTFSKEPGAVAHPDETGKYAFKLSKDTIYTPPFKIAYKDLTDRDHAFIRIRAKVFKTGEDPENPTLLTASFDYNGAVYKWENISLEAVPAGKWSEIELIYLTPEVRSLEDKLTVQFWHRQEHPIYVDEIKVEAFSPK
ncbi:MAG: hypothetical protein R3277_07115 [Brumimicrobium sp.]|nr:hypothetical protein [Brumimicrobium sp.]